MEDLRTELIEAEEKGNRIWNRICAGGEDAVYFLQADQELEQWLVLLKRFCRICSRSVWLICFDAVELDFCSTFTVTAEEAGALLKYYSIYWFYKDFYILSLDKPYSTHARNMLGVKGSTFQEIVFYDVFRLDRQMPAELL